MPGKNTIKFINSLKQKKFRQEHQLFIVEGEKMVNELMNSSLAIHSVYATGQWLSERGLEEREDTATLQMTSTGKYPLYQIKESELEKISSVKTPNKVLALVHTPFFTLTREKIKHSLTLVLDKVQDPGNLGTLIRSADWFGIDDVVLSNDSAEITNPKVVQSTMGSIFRVHSHYLDLPAFLTSPETDGLPVLGAFSNAEDIYSVELPEHGLLVLGNESRGISPEVEKLLTRKIGIPSSLKRKGTQPESLNMAVAGSIIISEFRRRRLI